LEDKARLIHELSNVKKQLTTEKHRNEVVEKVVETRVNKTQEKAVSELRNRTHKLEDELKNAKSVIEEQEVAHNRKTDHLKSRLEAAQSKYSC
jgi:CRISPR/Cas system CMR subunit Cmr6 (Cas7 group RAMP superfamily)